MGASQKEVWSGALLEDCYLEAKKKEHHRPTKSWTEVRDTVCLLIFKGLNIQTGRWVQGFPYM